MEIQAANLKPKEDESEAHKYIKYKVRDHINEK